jgi:hypothetical protein
VLVRHGLDPSSIACSGRDDTPVFLVPRLLTLPNSGLSYAMCMKALRKGIEEVLARNDGAPNCLCKSTRLSATARGRPAQGFC